MKKKMRMFALLLAMLFAIGGCGTSTTTDDTSAQTEVTTYTYTETTVTYPSREAEVPAVVTMPDTEDAVPLVVICHGHGGNRDEGLGFPAVAQKLAEQGVASIRMDFPGCGESTEAFTDNVLTNMKADVVAAVEYATAELNIDPAKVGIFGYSMGGRIALELLADDAYDFAAVGLLAPAADTEDMKNLFGGAENWDKMKAEAATEKGYADFTTIYGQEQQLSAKWFEDLEATTKDDLLAAAAENNDAPALVIYAVDDEAVAPAVSQAAADALGAQVITTPEDGHGYGFYSDKTEVLNTVTDGAANFFAESLK